MSVNERYEQLNATCGPHEKVFAHMGVHDGAGGWQVMPRKLNGQPLIEKFFINPKQKDQRLNELATNGWFIFEPQPEPEGVRKYTPPAETQETAPKPKRRSSRRKKVSDDLANDE